MPKPDEYRTMADECLRSAREAQTKEERLLYLNLARVWLEFASRQDAEASPAPAEPASASKIPNTARRAVKGLPLDGELRLPIQ
jgi:hypothetical protein